MMFSKLLVPVDGSENSLRALEAAIFLSKKIDAQTTALHVMEKAPTVYIHPQKELEELLKNYRKESERILEKCQQIGKNNRIELNMAISEGDVASKIIQYAEKGRFDMVVMGHRGSGKFKEMVLGSVSEKVLHRTKCSVLIVR
jgi:nucleotide-binding universal stress UspA family protein